MDLCGKIVKHKTFGRGKILEFANNYIKVIFDETKTERKFIYPSAFGTFLELEDNSLLSQIDEDKRTVLLKEAEDKRVKEEIAKTAQEIRIKDKDAGRTKSITAKTSEKNNIAFKCNYCDGGKSRCNVGFSKVCSEETIKYNIKIAKHIWCCSSSSLCQKYLDGEISKDELKDYSDKDGFICYESQMLRLWRAYAGITQNGTNKGKPMKLRNVCTNSLALLTTRLPYTDDKGRFIFAVFLVNESYEGDNVEEGFVDANPKFKLQLSLKEAKELKFWDFYFNPNKPEKMVLGSGLHRYLTNIQSAQVLKKICEIKKGTPEEELSEEFLKHYCMIKGMDIGNIPLPNGALKRN
jgi:hypothetical protein